MNRNQIIELYGYNAWANKTLMSVVKNLETEEFIRNLSSSFKSIRDTMVHILGAEELWLSRWIGEQGRTLLNPVDYPNYLAMAERWGDFSSQIDSFLMSLTETELLEEISYKNLEGVAYTLELWKQMLHVTNHSSFHRGQVVTMLRQVNKQPPSLDMIYYYLAKK
ncbi:DinB family protein [Desulfosporosinus hippei]|uniref:Uncharacterized damage-inducible protein DinB (Forms a four-helix bundle) n=1 Tax=Desulfosporosinus hippei DSM 8344 TaxID=1121419 RepID=A0A1G8HNS1_9FIRM|nr:DinB family protein [Desulfosporosinus hippei]SDI08336.1 Uncharacterized damage-inducible protein DinB (forms a four-helix bundle) [Desulfosporosinus hippei DSM 8344]